MFFEILRFELRQQWRAPLAWIIAAAFAALAFALASSDVISIGGASGNVLRNAPLVIARLLASLTAPSMLLVTVFVAGAVLRDFEQRTAELMFSTPVSRGAYLGGRFAAGYLTALVVLLLCALAIALGNAMPWIDPLRLGPGEWRGYAWGLGVLVIPDMLFVAALLFALACATRSLLATYLGVIAFFVLHAVAGLLTGDVNHHTLAALLDPFGGRTLAIVTRYWSADESNHRLPVLEGLLLYNRLLWLAISAALWVLAFTLFRTDRDGQAPRAGKRGSVSPLSNVSATAPCPGVQRRDDVRSRWLQLQKMFVFDAVSVLRGVPFLVMLAFGLFNLIAVLAFSQHHDGTPSYPVTRLMLETLRGSYQWLLYIVITFYAGELVWRDRSQRSAEVSDAYPLADWIAPTAKLLTLVTVIVLFLLTGSVVGIGWQLAHDYTRLQLGLYASQLALDAITFVLLAVLAVFLQVVCNNKFLGYLLIILWFASQIGFGLLHWDHHLYDYASTSATPYSDMNGFGHFLTAALWFDLYWACLALALLVLTALLWVRGTGQDLRARLHEARRRMRAPSAIALSAALLGFAGVGGWIYYNTYVLNAYLPDNARLRMQADYEKRYATYRDLPQPRIAAVQAEVDIYPYARRLHIRGHYTLVNRHAAPISELHLSVDPAMRLSALDFAPHDTLREDTRLGYRIYRLTTPLAPGASMRLDFTLDYAPHGFRNDPGDDTFLVANGTFFNSSRFPHVGYQPAQQITDRNDRRTYGLSETVPRMPRLDDAQARANTYIANDADWIAFDTTVSTAPDQIALAPGHLQKSWIAHGRRYFHYAMDRPMLPFFAYLSARYAVRRDTWQGMPIEVYYTPAHAWNVARMIQSVKDSLAYYQANFAPYPFHQVRIAEFPDYANFAQSFASTIPYAESAGFIADLRDRSKLDDVYYATAHEMAHQWWAHQVIGANQQGSPMLSESLAQYSALMVMKHTYGASKMRQFLKYELDGYLAGRATEKIEEQPLAKVENQPYIHYQKGSLAFYALQDYVGENTLDRVLKKFLHDKAFQAPPYTNSAELMDYLDRGTGPTFRPLLDDLFWKITLYDNRITTARAQRLPDGRYRVTLQLHTGKVYVDGQGRETPAHPDLPITVGVFAAGNDGHDGKPLYLQKQVLPPGDSSLTVTVDAPPAQTGIDPYNVLIDRVSSDNRVPVSLP
ncbi:MAG: M1 family aminopeptidase [Dyella sp.]